MDQAAILKERHFPAAMILPTLFPASSKGIETAVRHFVERSGCKAVIYMKDPNYITPESVKALATDGLVSWVKYAVVREDPSDDPLLEKLTELVDPNMVVSGIGEQPAIVHLRKFGVVGFTSDVCASLPIDPWPC